jgi:hypothetical protein
VKRCCLIILLFLATIGCRSLPTAVRYEGGEGSTPETAVVIEGAKSERELILALQKWIRRRFPHSVIEERVIAIDPLTGYGLGEDQLTFHAVRPGFTVDAVKIKTRKGKATVYCSYETGKVSGEPEDLSLLYRCIQLIQDGSIHRGMLVDELRRVMTSTSWIPDQDVFFAEEEVRAILSVWPDGIKLTGSPPGNWQVTFKIENKRVVAYSISKFVKGELWNIH